MDLKTNLETTNKKPILKTELPESKGKALNRKLQNGFEILGTISPKIWLSIAASIILLKTLIGYAYFWFSTERFFHEVLGDVLQNIDFTFYLVAITLLLAVLAVFNLFEIWQIYKEKKSKTTVIVGVNVAILFLILGILFGSYAIRSPKIVETYPSYEANLSSFDEPLYVKFAVPVRTDALKPSIVQDIPGSWEWQPYLGISELTREGYFYPEISSLSDQRYVVYIAGINKITDSVEHEFGYVFRSPKIPNLVSSSPSTGEVNIASDETIELTFDSSYKDILNWDIEVTPEIDFDLDTSMGTKLKIIPKKSLEQGLTYTIDVSYKPTIVDLKSKEVIREEPSVEYTTISFTTVSEPLIEEFSPVGNKVRPDEDLFIRFASPMDMSSVLNNLQLIPEIPGTWEILDDSTIQFNNTEPLIKNTNFKVILKPGSVSVAGGEIEKEIEYTFKTLGKATVEKISPENGATGIDENTPIRLTFDQEIDKKSAEDRFNISPNIQGSISWEGNTLIFNPSNQLTYQQTYTVTVDPGVVGTYGLTSTDQFRSVFTVRQDLVVFSIPIYYQPPGFACNIFTAKMILSWKGIEIEYTDIIAEIGYNDTRNGNSWVGNPYTEYVGTADGSWGYGVYYPPIQNVFARRGISSTSHTNWDASSMASAINEGKPVIIWRYNGVGGGQDISWTAEDGQFVNAFNGMHGSVITGFTGSISNPTSFYVNDPWLGQFWMDTQTLDYYWSFSGRMALVVN